MASPMDLDNHPPGTSATPGLRAPRKSSKIQRCSLAKAGEGDVVLMLKPNGKAIHVLMNAKILGDVSSDFKDMLESNVSGGVPRSSKHPQELELSEDEDDWRGFTLLLCAIFHSRAPKADFPRLHATTETECLSHLLEVVIFAKKFCEFDTMKETIAPLFLQRFTEFDPQPQSTQDQRVEACNYDALLATIAYVLEQEVPFALFTRRMILDHDIRLSTLDADVLQHLPPMALRM
jgi:hypothetical protein